MSHFSPAVWWRWRPLRVFQTDKGIVPLATVIFIVTTQSNYGIHFQNGINRTRNQNIIGDEFSEFCLRAFLSFKFSFWIITYLVFDSRIAFLRILIFSSVDSIFIKVFFSRIAGHRPDFTVSILPMFAERVFSCTSWLDALQSAGSSITITGGHSPTPLPLSAVSTEVSRNVWPQFSSIINHHQAV